MENQMTDIVRKHITVLLLALALSIPLNARKVWVGYSYKGDFAEFESVSVKGGEYLHIFISHVH